MQSRRSDTARKQSSRLPAIAPKDDRPSSPVLTSNVPAGSNRVPPDLPRTRLPPRSRTGCWTCRTRKVKCDEGRPTCGQCARLQHRCDYSPRLSFRDDTPRIIGRMQEVSTNGSVVWDPHSRDDISPTRPRGDNLPPFDTLTNDEEREKKAEFQEPGTYLVIVNPESFSSLPEYSDGETTPSVPSRKMSLTQSSLRESNQVKKEDISADRNIVILPKFEDCMRRSVAQGSLKTVRGSESPPSNHSDTFEETNPPELIRGPTPPASPVRREHQSGNDARLLKHYRQFVSPQLAQFLASETHITRASTEMDAFETQADDFPPLHHAIMALSALSLAQRDGGQSIDALQHYQQTLPSLQTTLKSASDMFSDGALFTHFFLLLYEIAAAEPRSNNLWSQHLNHISRIFLERRSANAFPEYDRIQWFVSVIDTYALLSGSGTAGFTAKLNEESEESTASTSFSARTDFNRLNEASLQQVSRLHQSVQSIAMRLGRLATKLRAENYASNAALSPGLIDVMARQRAVHELQVELRHVWAAQVPDFIPEGWITNRPELPARAMAVFEHAFALHRMCIIYSHTSMWSGQRAETIPDLGDEVGCCVTELLQLSNAAVESKRLELRFIVFPLFIAGYAASSASQKMLVLELMSTLERESIGQSIKTIRELLQVVYDRQKEMLINVGHSLMVDWLDIKQEQGLHIINFGL